MFVVCEEVHVFDFKGLDLWEGCGDDVVQEGEDAEPGGCPVEGGEGWGSLGLDKVYGDGTVFYPGDVAYDL